MTSSPTVETSNSRKSKFRLRTWIQRLHLMSTLIVGVLILVVAFSGTVALFREPAQRLFLPHLYRVTPSRQLTNIDEAFQTVKATFPDKEFGGITLRPNDPYQFDIHNEVTGDFEMVFLDPGTGKVNGYYHESTWWIGWITVLHRSLFASQMALPILGVTLDNMLLTITAIALLIMVFTGAYLWFPGIKHFWNGFKLRQSPSVFIRHYDWHKLMGILALPWLWMWGLSGLLYFHGALTPVWNAIVLSPSPEAQEIKSMSTGRSPISLEQARTIAAATTGYPVMSITPPEQADSPIKIGVEKPGYYLWKYWEYPGTHDVSIDQYSGKVLNVHSFITPNPFVFDSLLGIHFGAPADPTWRIIWAFFGLMPLVLAFTGLSMWWIKRQRRLHSQRLSKWSGNP